MQMPITLNVVGDLLIIARIAHAIGLKHDNMGHIGRLIGGGDCRRWRPAAQ